MKSEAIFDLILTMAQRSSLSVPLDLRCDHVAGVVGGGVIAAAADSLRSGEFQTANDLVLLANEWQMRLLDAVMSTPEGQEGVANAIERVIDPLCGAAPEPTLPRSGAGPLSEEEIDALASEG